MNKMLLMGALALFAMPGAAMVIEDRNVEQHPEPKPERRYKAKPAVVRLDDQRPRPVPKSDTLQRILRRKARK